MLSVYWLMLILILLALIADFVEVWLVKKREEMYAEFLEMKKYLDENNKGDE